MLLEIRGQRKLLLVAFSCMFLTLSLSESLFATGDSVAGKKLIRHSRELRKLAYPSMAAADLPTKVAAWQDTGLDGMVFHIYSHRNPAEPSPIHGQWWNAAMPRTYDEFIPDIQAYKSVTDWGRLTDNFLVSYSSVWLSGEPGVVNTSQDWFNDDHWDVLTNNVGIQARIAKEIGFRGIELDVEQYRGQAPLGPWTYPFWYDEYATGGYLLAGETSPRPFAEVYDKVYDRGQQYGQTICGAFPGLTLMMMPDYYNYQTGIATEADLYPAFLNGVVAGMDADAKLVLAEEQTYFTSDYNDLKDIRDGVVQQIMADAHDPVLMADKLSISLGLWTDGKNRMPFSDTDVNQNFRTPAEHRNAVANTLALSDEYAWSYSETWPNNFLDVAPSPLTQEYLQANADAHMLKPVEDTYIERTTESGVADGTGDYLAIQNEFGDQLYESWLKFDLTDLDPEDALVTEATLSVWLKSSYDVGLTSFELVGVTDDNWEETTLTGNNAPALDSVIALVDFDSSDLVNYVRVDIDVTDYVQASVSTGQDHTVSFALVPDAGDSPMIRVTSVSHRTAGNPSLEAYISGLTVFVAPDLGGDVDGDGFVGGADISRIITNWGLTGGATRSQGDLTGDGTVGAADYNAVLINWGNGVPPQPPGSIPEPGTLALLAGGILVGIIRRRR